MRALWWAGTLRRPRREPSGAGGARREAPASSTPSVRTHAGDRAIASASSNAGSQSAPADLIERIGVA
ncbi:hypothetical protein C1I92_14915 [Jiangella anatolica]|uniref:Uncharacterized protein n=1 Tax=Jiangella anatolica TaxID=2670374 RepID=A0A2W2B695_9ACTN|nr:hypothetical protein C1I92_14915 [Jiangella anatolica]